MKNKYKTKLGNLLSYKDSRNEQYAYLQDKKDYKKYWLRMHFMVFWSNYDPQSKEDNKEWNNKFIEDKKKQFIRTVEDIYNSEIKDYYEVTPNIDIVYFLNFKTFLALRDELKKSGFKKKQIKKLFKKVFINNVFLKELEDIEHFAKKRNCYIEKQKTKNIKD